MLSFRLKPSVWIDAIRKRAESVGAFVMVLKKGDPDGGSVVIWVENNAREIDLYTAQTQMDGTRAWRKERELTLPAANERLSRLKRMDQDMWLIEITNSKGQNFINEPILED